MTHGIQGGGKNIRYSAVIGNHCYGTAVSGRHQGEGINDMMHDLSLIGIVALVIAAGHKGGISF